MNLTKMGLAHRLSLTASGAHPQSNEYSKSCRGITFRVSSNS